MAENSYYVEYFGVAGSGKTFAANLFNTSIGSPVLCPPKADFVSLAKCSAYMIAIACCAPFLNFVLPHKTRIAFLLRTWKRLARITFLLRHGGSFACDHGVMQDLCHVAPSWARDVALRLCVRAIEKNMNPTKQVEFVYLSIDLHDAVERRVRRQGPIDRGKSVDELLREHSAIDWDAHLASLADRAARYANHISVKVLASSNAALSQSK